MKTLLSFVTCALITLTITGCRTAPPQYPTNPATTTPAFRTLAVPTPPGTGQTISLAWDATAQPFVSLYRIYRGGVSHTYTNVVDVPVPQTSVTVTNLTPGATYYFAATCVASYGLESGYSTEVSYTVPLIPNPPQNFRLTVLTASAPSGPWSPATNLVLTLDTNTIASYFRLEATPQ